MVLVPRMSNSGPRLARFQAADCTVAEFCNREGVSVPAFYHWRKRLAGQAGTTGAKAPDPAARRSRRTTATGADPPQPGRLLPVNLVSGPEVHGREIELPGSVRLAVAPDPELVSFVLREVLNRTLPSLEVRPC